MTWWTPTYMFFLEQNEGTCDGCRIGLVGRYLRDELLERRRSIVACHGGPPPGLTAAMHICAEVAALPSMNQRGWLM